MKRILTLLLTLVVLGPIVGFAYTAYFDAQRADYGWSPALTKPTFSQSHPRVVIDEAHNNASTSGIANRYWPFARLLRADGFDVKAGTRKFDPESLAGIDVLVIANASGASKPQAFGINLPFLGDDDANRGADAFTSDEIVALESWVESGGSLLLIADHAPFGESASALAEAFGVTMFKGYVEVPDEVSDPLIFSRENGRLGDHVTTAGVNRVATFTGQSLHGPDEAVVLLHLPASAVEYRFDESSQDFVPGPAGSAQGLAMEYGNGRLIVLGEAAMLTAQVHQRKPFGMNLPSNDNQQFALNIMHWLSRAL